MIWGHADRLTAAERALAGVETALRERRFSDLGGAMAALERAMQSLQATAQDRAAAGRLQSLRIRAGRVADLLRAVMAGMRDARSSIAVPSGFSSYDAFGRSGQIGSAQTRFERRR